MKRTLIVVGIAAVLGYLGYQFYRGIDDAYAEMSAASMVILYMKEHQQEWPPDWESLQPYYSKNEYVAGWSFGEFKSRIRIDFQANSKNLSDQCKNSDVPPFNVIGAKNLLGSTLEGGPNEAIYDYFKSNPVLSREEQSQLIEKINLAVHKKMIERVPPLQPFDPPARDIREEIVGTWIYPHEHLGYGVMGYSTRLELHRDGTFSKWQIHRTGNEVFHGHWRYLDDTIIEFNVLTRRAHSFGAVSIGVFMGNPPDPMDVIEEQLLNYRINCVCTINNSGVLSTSDVQCMDEMIVPEINFESYKALDKQKEND